MKQLFTFIFVGLAGSVLGQPREKEESKWDKDFSLEAQLDYRLFSNEGLYPRQEQYFLSGALTPSFSFESKDGKHFLQGKFFGRLDRYDANRTHLDIRELYYQRILGDTEISVGFKKIFWGVTESVHLVDIINQVDQVETYDGESKLGQPMMHLSSFTKWGTFDFFYLPFARKRQFPAQRGRLRFPEVIERDDLSIDANSGVWHPSLAVRWSNFFGLFDVGLSHFYGVGREPLLFGIEQDGSFELFYPIIHQPGLDVQATTGPILWKLEAIYRYASRQDFSAVAAGFEYTFSNIKSSGLDIGLVAEYLFDSRDEQTFSSLDNDVFVGTRFAFNDVKSTEFLTGGIIDLTRSTYLYSFEGNRRIGNSWKVELEVRLFQQVSREEIVYVFRQDDFLETTIIKYF
ncbi:MAG: hypothetical protein AAF600_14765 [Bacteroidota bacterium]